MDNKDIKRVVREGYADRAKKESSCCEATPSCCGSPIMAESVSRSIGYSEDDLRSVPEGSNLGLGCGNPVALASIKEGETVLDLGSGAGFDCFLAAQKVGPRGKVIGVDMTPEMIDKARENAEKVHYDNVEFKLGDIENLPLENKTVDVIISNCVINLSPDKEKVFKEAYRVLKPGGRLMISDLVLTKELPDFIKNNMGAYVACVSGAVLKDTYIDLIYQAGFLDVQILDEALFPVQNLIDDPAVQADLEEFEEKEIPWASILDAAASIKSIKVYARK